MSRCLADQTALFGSAASASTWWWLPERGDRPGGSYRLRQAGFGHTAARTSRPRRTLLRRQPQDPRPDFLPTLADGH
jgi:hypothetical protein